MKSTLIILLFALRLGAQTNLMPPVLKEPDWDLHMGFQSAWLGHWLWTNGVRAYPVERDFYITNAPFGTTVYRVTGTNALFESLPSNAVTNFVQPLFTNSIATFGATLKLTNAAGPFRFYTLCESTNLREWTPARGAILSSSKTNW